MRELLEIKITKYTLAEILDRHLHWLNRDCDGWENMRADLSNANLSNVNLSYANLSDANLSNAILFNANLRDANLSNAILFNANLSDAKLFNAILFNANLSYANLSDAELHKVNLSYASLHNAKAIPYVPLACPSDGAFIAWKKVKKYLIKLEIPASAKRSSATTQKCRASKAKVLGIYTLDGKKTNLKNILNTNQAEELDYIVGETVYPDYYDEDRWNECSHGIHFFINKQDAINF